MKDKNAKYTTNLHIYVDYAPSAHYKNILQLYF